MTILEKHMRLDRPWCGIDDNGIPVYIGADGESDDYGGWYDVTFFVEDYMWPWLHNYKVWKQKDNYCYVDPVDWNNLPF